MRFRNPTARRWTLVVKLAFGWAAWGVGTPHAQGQRQMEALDRGSVAFRQPDGAVFVAWRLLGTDPDGLAFRVLRSTAGHDPITLTPRPIAATCYVDPTADAQRSWTYVVQPVDRVGHDLHVGYNLPPHPSFFLRHDFQPPVATSICTPSVRRERRSP